MNNILEKIKDYGDKKWHQYIYTYLMWGFLLIYIISLMGVATINPSYISTVDTIAKLYVALLLMIRFNPFVRVNKMTTFDKELAWNAGVFLFLSSTIVVAVKRQFTDYIT